MTLSYQEKALEQAAIALNTFRENKDKPPHSRWVDPHSKPSVTQKQKANELIANLKRGKESDTDARTAGAISSELFSNEELEIKLEEARYQDSQLKQVDLTPYADNKNRNIHE